MTALPRLLVLTDGQRAGAAGRDLQAVLAEAVEAGARGVVVRERHLPAPERRRLVRWVADLLTPVDGLVVVATPPTGEGDNLHLQAVTPVPAPRPPVMGRSCHSPAELARAGGEGCDYVTLSPVFPTLSKPGYGPALGLAGLEAAAAATPLPVYALGGITPDTAAGCLAAGAAGVAVMGAVMAADEPGRVVAGLLDAMGALR